MKPEQRIAQGLAEFKRRVSEGVVRQHERNAYMRGYCHDIPYSMVLKILERKHEQD
jgi:hypothetical protein